MAGCICHLMCPRRSLQSRKTVVNPFQTHYLKRSQGSRLSQRGQTGRRFPATSPPPRQTRCRRHACTGDRLHFPQRTTRASRVRTSALRIPPRSTRFAACPSAWTPPWSVGRAASPASRAAPAVPCRLLMMGEVRTPRRNSATMMTTSRSCPRRCCC